MENDFVTWLSNELNTRSWSMSELARRAGITHGAISHVLSESRNPGPDFCKAIARAFGIPPEQVFRLAGLLPIVSQNKEEDEELLSYFHGLPPRTRTQVLITTRALHEERGLYQIDKGDQ